MSLTTSKGTSRFGTTREVRFCKSPSARTSCFRASMVCSLRPTNPDRPTSPPRRRSIVAASCRVAEVVGPPRSSDTRACPASAESIASPIRPPDRQATCRVRSRPDPWQWSEADLLFNSDLKSPVASRRPSVRYQPDLWRRHISLPPALERHPERFARRF